MLMQSSTTCVDQVVELVPHSSCGSYFDANKKDFPTVPYSNLDFNDGKCNTGSGNIENYQDINQV